MTKSKVLARSVRKLEEKIDAARVRCMETIDKEMGDLLSPNERELLYETLMETLTIEREANLDE